jgi:hypothetical protein
MMQMVLLGKLASRFELRVAARSRHRTVLDCVTNDELTNGREAGLKLWSGDVESRLHVCVL